MVLSPQKLHLYWGYRLWVWTCTLVMIGVVAGVVVSFTTASFSQEHLIKLLLKRSCLGQGYILSHTCRPGKMWWVWHSQCKGWWKKSLHPGFSDFSPLVYIRTMLQLSIRVFTVTSLLGITVLFSLWLPLKGRNMQAINGWLFSSKLAPATAHWLWQLRPFPHEAAALPKAGVWPHVAADVACKSGGHLGALLPSLRCSADALAGEEVQKIIHPRLISGLEKLWKTSSPLCF